jgi:UPF0755 protein
MKRFILYTLTVAIITLLLFFVWLNHYANTPLPLISAEKIVVIKPNSGLSSIANQLVAQGVFHNALPFILLARSLNKQSALQAGEYTFEAEATPLTILLALNQGKTTKGTITFIEGKTFKDMRVKLQSNSAIENTINNVSDAAVMQLIGASQKHPEGLFFPDTYHFNKGTKDIVILKNAYNAMMQKLAIAWQNRADNLPYQNSYQALIMASIIEKETGKASERQTIAGVFVNRLRMGMLLQTDPTVIYGMGDTFDGNIRRKDLRKDTDYNTYTRSGLPPTPIAMPSLAAIEAALHPEKTKALYFVGKGDGSHEFSNSLVQHNRAVAKYQLKK